MITTIDAFSWFKLAFFSRPCGGAAILFLIWEGYIYDSCGFIWKGCIPEINIIWLYVYLFGLLLVRKYSICFLLFVFPLLFQIFKKLFLDILRFCFQLKQKCEHLDQSKASNTRKTLQNAIRPQVRVVSYHLWSEIFC